MEQINTENLTAYTAFDEFVPDIQSVPPATGSTPYSAEHAAHEYPQALIDTRYEMDTGLRVAAVGGDPNLDLKNEVIRVHRGITYKRVHWTVERLGAQPQIPSADTSNPNEILVKQIIIACNPLQMPMGATQKAWRVSGLYIYALIKPLNERCLFPLGTTPAEIEDSQQHNIRPDHFDSEWLDASHAPPVR